MPCIAFKRPGVWSEYQQHCGDQKHISYKKLHLWYVIFLNIHWSNHSQLWDNNGVFIFLADIQVRPLMLVIKKWARHCEINDASKGTLSSYTLALMVLNYLQCEFLSDLTILWSCNSNCWLHCRCQTSRSSFATDRSSSECVQVQKKCNYFSLMFWWPSFLGF